MKTLIALALLGLLVTGCTTMTPTQRAAWQQEVLEAWAVEDEIANNPALQVYRLR